MKKILYIILISLFSLTIISCAKKSSSSSSDTTDTTVESCTTTTTDTTTQMGGSRQGVELSLLYCVTTLAGTGSTGSANGTGTSASFNLPEGITTDGTNLYVTENNNHSIRQIVISTGAVTTVAGTIWAGEGISGHANGTGTSASFRSPIGVTTDGTNLYVSNSHTIRKIE